MAKFYTKIYYNFRNLILYGVIGCFTSGLDFCVFTLLTLLGNIHYIFANCISVFVGISTSFLLNRTYNFKVKDKTKQRFVIFLTVGICGLCLSNLILYVGIDYLYGNKAFVKLASIVLVVGFQFLLNKFVTFRQKL